MFLKANYSSIPAYKDIPQIASEDIRNHLPARFDGQDKDLLDAEASIDPLVNNAPPTPSGIDITRTCVGQLVVLFFVSYCFCGRAISKLLP